MIGRRGSRTSPAWRAPCGLAQLAAGDTSRRVALSAVLVCYAGVQVKGAKAWMEEKSNPTVETNL